MVEMTHPSDNDVAWIVWSGLDGKRGLATNLPGNNMLILHEGTLL